MMNQQKSIIIVNWYKNIWQKLFLSSPIRFSKPICLDIQWPHVKRNMRNRFKILTKNNLKPKPRRTVSTTDVQLEKRTKLYIDIKVATSVFNSVHRFVVICTLCSTFMYTMR